MELVWHEESEGKCMHRYNEQKMFTHLSGFLKGAGMIESLRALGDMREKHGQQRRKGGQLFIVHPLWMANYAIALGIRDDNIVATVLLHDVCEDTETKVDDLPFNDTIRRGVRYMTFHKYDDEDKPAAKKRYFYGLLESREALMCKGLDRFMNLSTMEGVLEEEAIIKNVKETDELLLPVMKAGKERWPELSDYFFVMRANIRAVNDTLAAAHGIKLKGDDAAFPFSRI